MRVLPTGRRRPSPGRGCFFLEAWTFRIAGGSAPPGFERSSPKSERLPPRVAGSPEGEDRCDFGWKDSHQGEDDLQEEGDGSPSGGRALTAVTAVRRPRGTVRTQVAEAREPGEEGREMRAWRRGWDSNPRAA
jgi:hypothetical protein